MLRIQSEKFRIVSVLFFDYTISFCWFFSADEATVETAGFIFALVKRAELQHFLLLSLQSMIFFSWVRLLWETAGYYDSTTVIKSLNSFYYWTLLKCVLIKKLNLNWFIRTYRSIILSLFNETEYFFYFCGEIGDDVIKSCVIGLQYLLWV